MPSSLLPLRGLWGRIVTRICIDNPFSAGDPGTFMVPDWLWTLPISFKAKAVFCFMLSCPDGFLPLVGQVEAVTGLGREARQSAYRELRECGLLVTRSGTLSLSPSLAVL